MFIIMPMRSIWRTLDRGLARDIGLVCLADGVVGLSYGAISVGGGLPLWVPVLLSIVVFAGASQFLRVGETTRPDRVDRLHTEPVGRCVRQTRHGCRAAGEHPARRVRSGGQRRDRYRLAALAG